MNKRGTSKRAKVGAEVFFDEIGFVLDDSQFRDAISMIDMYHFYLRRHKYKRFRPSDEDLKSSPKLALLKFAGAAILDEVHQKRRRWMWEYFRERRDDREQYVPLFLKRESGGALSPEVGNRQISRRRILTCLSGIIYFRITGAKAQIRRYPILSLHSSFSPT